jgi:glyoxylase-like metal-dependent hydrolase (beta-lactamase superfamily II)
MSLPREPRPSPGHHIERIAGLVMPVNSFLVHGPEGVVVIDGMLTVSDAERVRAAVERSGSRLAGVLVTHPHPDHYAGLAHIVGPDEVPIVATPAVDAVIRRDDAVKDTIVGPMMGPEWPAERIFPDHLVEPNGQITLAGVTFTVEELGPGESDVDTLWWLDPATVFAGDLAYSGMHAYLADGMWQDWLTSLAAVEARLDPGTTLYVGHGAPGTRALLARQRRYIETFVAALDTHADAVAAGDHAPVVAAMQALLPTDDLLFLMDLSIDPVLAARGAGTVGAS